MSEEQRNWQVTRWCCTSGQCVDCHRHGKRTRVVQASRLTKALAKVIAVNWSRYEADASPMPAPADFHVD